MNKNEIGRKKRHNRIRKTVQGTSERPRLSVHGSHKNLCVQLIDDVASTTIISATTLEKQFKDLNISGGNIQAAEKLGEIISAKAKEKSITKVVFDRGGWLYHGRIKALADACRKNGLEL